LPRGNGVATPNLTSNSAPRLPHPTEARSRPAPAAILPDNHDAHPIAVDLPGRSSRHAQLRRQVKGRIRYEPVDHFWLAALSSLLPRHCWSSVFPVTPGTLSAWHRRLIARGVARPRFRLACQHAAVGLTFQRNTVTSWHRISNSTSLDADERLSNGRLLEPHRRAPPPTG
jgi:hypothetical protein